MQFLSPGRGKVEAHTAEFDLSSSLNPTALPAHLKYALVPLTRASVEHGGLQNSQACWVTCRAASKFIRSPNE